MGRQVMCLWLLLLVGQSVAQNPGVVGTTGGNANNRNCIFPFIYKGVSYNYCITLNEKNNKPWCATLANYDSYKQWGYCKLTLSAMKTKNGNGNDANCVFPFRYANVLYYNCITVNYNVNRPWCAVTSNFDIDKKWGECIIYPQIQTTGGNGGNRNCVFPFKYDGQEITGCLQDSVRGAWCGVSYDYEKDGLWGQCTLTYTGCSNSYNRYANQLSYGGVGQSSAQSVSACQNLCNLDTQCKGFDYDFNNGLGTRCFLHFNSNNFNSRVGASNVDEYVLSNRCAGVVTTGGNSGSNNATCYFPYKYKGLYYASCNSAKWYGPWCGTTADYDGDKTWGDCSNIPTQ